MEDSSEEDNRLTCWGCNAKFEGTNKDAIESGWRIVSEELFCESCVEAFRKELER